MKKNRKSNVKLLKKLDILSIQNIIMARVTFDLRAQYIGAIYMAETGILLQAKIKVS